MAAQAGWYVDPRDARQYRYWDGDRWSQSTQPIPELAEAASVNGESNGSLSSGGTTDPVGAEAFDQAPETPAANGDDDVLADFMWTSGFGETPDDPAANAGPTLFAPGADAPVAPEPEPVVAPLADSAAVPPAPTAPPMAASASPDLPTTPDVPAAPEAPSAPPLFAAPAAASAGASLFSTPAAGAPVFDPAASAGAAPDVVEAPDATPTPPAASFAAGSGAPPFEPTVVPSSPEPVAEAPRSLFAPIDPSLQPIFDARVGPSIDATTRRGRKGRLEAPAQPEPPMPMAFPTPVVPVAPVIHAAPGVDPVFYDAPGTDSPDAISFESLLDANHEPPPEVVGAVKVKKDRKSKAQANAKPPKLPKPQKVKSEKSKVPILLGALAVVVLGAGAFILLSGGDDDADTAADVAGTTVEKTSTTVATDETIAPAATGDVPEVTAAETPAVPAASPEAVAGLQAAFDAEATRACDVIKADPGLFTENVIAYDEAWAAVPKTYEDLQRVVNECTYQARDEALQRVAALEAQQAAG